MEKAWLRILQNVMAKALAWLVCASALSYWVGRYPMARLSRGAIVSQYVCLSRRPLQLRSRDSRGRVRQKKRHAAFSEKGQERSMTTRIRVLIVDDQTLVREGFRKLLEFEPDFEVVGTAGDGEAAITAVEQLQEAGTPPDVILMDIRMPRMDGIAATRALKERWPDAHIVILTTFDDTELIHAGLRAGALGYSLKDITAEQLALTVRTAARGQVLLQPDIASKLFSTLTPSAPARSLTPSTNFTSSTGPTYIDATAYVEQ